MRHRALDFLVACLAAALVSFVVLMALHAPVRDSPRQTLLAMEVIGVGMAFTYPLVFLPVFVVLDRRRRRRPSRRQRASAALVGALLSLVTFGWTAWALEGFEYGLWSLLRAPGTLGWMLALALGGAAFGLAWQARGAGRARPR